VIWLLACHRRRLLKEGFLPPILFFSSPLSSTNNNHQHQPLPSRTTIPTLHFIAPLNPSFVRTINNLRQSSTSDSHQPPTVINLRQSSTSDSHQPPTIINLPLLNILLGTFEERLGQSPGKTQNLPYCLVPACSLPVEPDSRCASHSWHSTCSKLSGMQDSHESFGIENPPTLVGGVFLESREQVVRVWCRVDPVFVVLLGVG
jgi:hypothetical protein